LSEVEIDEPHVRVPGHQHVFRFEIQVHEPAVVHVFEGEGGIDQDVCHMFAQDWIAPAKEFFEVGTLHVFHQAIERAIDFTVLVVVDDVFVVVNLGEDLAAPQEAALRQEIEAQAVVKFSERVRFALLIGGHPDVRHPATIDQLLQIKAAKGARFGRRSDTHRAVCLEYHSAVKPALCSTRNA